MLAWGFVCLWFVWAVGAIYFFGDLPAKLSGLLAASYVLGCVVAWFRMINKRRWLKGLAGSIVAVYLLTLFQQPSNQRRWAADNARTAIVTMKGDDVTIANFRHTILHSENDADVQFKTLAFKLSQLRQVWFVVQRFTALEGIAHNFLSFSFDSGNGVQYFSISVEIRREQGEQFSPIKGLYREYELIYVIADERDEIGSRTVFRPNDRVYLFPVKADPEHVQQLFVDIAGRVNRLSQQPEFYHSILNNCTNNIVLHTYKLTPEPINWLDPRILIPGYADRFAFSQRLIGADVGDFATLQSRFRIDEVARQNGITPAFSNDIRLPSIHQPQM